MSLISGVRRICVQWPRFGPYHLARLHAAHEACQRLGIELVALETAARSDLYNWRVETRETPFRREQVFTDRSWETISPAEMHQAVSERLDAINPDVLAIHTYSLPDSRACLAWCKANAKASIVMTNSKADDAVRSRLKEWLKARLIKTFDAAFLAGAPQKAYFESLGYSANAIYLGYNVVDNAFFADPARYSGPMPLPGLDSEAPFMLASNRFIERKNLKNLLSAYGIYRKQTPNPFRLIMLGSGVLQKDLERLIEQQEIEGVEFTGFRQIEELPVYYERAQFFVHPSRVDTWAMVVNEAMAAGLPVVVSTGAGCHKDLVQHAENGFVFDPDDIEGLARHMKTLTEDANFRVCAGEKSLAIISGWNLDRFADGLLAASETALERRGNPLGIIPRLMIALLRRSSSSSAFHSVES